ncbi:hypothetical protein [Cyanothece sp. BG0011]|uniref:hypothetical protein n=1 Tax=Cyanothece sp. BG0011 TaxID=2082950 RepID=UPI0018E5859E|nr:hypothetical protein [Cyanothece sp. BG0011]
MVLPLDYNDFEHLQSVIRKLHNKEVREAFSDLGGDEWLPNINSPRASLRQACTIYDSDSALIMLLKQNLYFLTLRKAKDYQAPILGMPKGSLDPIRKYKPQIYLYFKEDSGDVEEGYGPVEGRISFRLMDEDSESITKTKLTTLANKIKTEFGVSNGYTWKKGKEYYSYTDKEKGYQLQILAFSETEAKQLINKVLDIQGHTFSAKKFRKSSNDDPTSAYPTIPPNQSILGELVREPRLRPVATVRFQYAIANLWGRPQPIPLYDRTFEYLNALVTEY